MKHQKISSIMDQLDKVHESMPECTNKHIIQDAVSQFEELDDTILLIDVEDVLKGWLAYRKENYYKSDALDVEKKLLDEYIQICQSRYA